MQISNENDIANCTKPGRYWVKNGNGLFLLVQNRKRKGQVVGLRKYYGQRLLIGEKKTDLSLSKIDALKLKQAKEIANKNYALTVQGVDPRIAKKAKNRGTGKSANTGSGAVPTLKEMAVAVHKIKSKGFTNGKHKNDWMASLENHCKPILNMPVDEIEPQHILNVLTHECKVKNKKVFWLDMQDTSDRVRQRLRTSFDYAIAHKHITDNPAGGVLDFLLPARKKSADKHYSYLHYSEVGQAIQKIRASNSFQSSKLAFEFLVLMAARSGEVRLATWDEFDLEKRIWCIPAKRMKTRLEHCQPLSKQAVMLLLAIAGNAIGKKKITAQDAAIIPSGENKNLVFPSKLGRPLSDATFSKMCRDNGIDCVPHGFRSSFATWANEQTTAKEEVREKCLAHQYGSKVYRSYNQSDLLSDRRDLMQQWADFLIPRGN